MTDKQVIKCMDNSWKALASIYASQPDEATRKAMNMVARIIGEVESEVNKSHKDEEGVGREEQITMEEWIAFLEGED